MEFDAILNKELKKNKNAAKRLKKHWKDIQNIEKIDFGKVFLSFSLQHIHRYFKGNDVSLLATFAVFEFLHNLNEFIEGVNSFKRMKAINEAAGMELCVLSNGGMGVSSVLPAFEKRNNIPFMVEYYKNRINELKNGHIGVRPEVWNYVFIGKNISDNEKKEMEKEAAQEVLNILKESRNILEFIENNISECYEKNVPENDTNVLSELI